MVRYILKRGLGNKKEAFDSAAGLSIERALENYNPAIDVGSCLILSGGNVKKCDYKPLDGDIIYIRELPGGITAAIIIGALAVTLAVAGAVTMGVMTAKQKQQMADIEDKQKKAARNSGEKPDAAPFIKGANNQSATGQTFPYIIGRTLMTPYKLCSPHYEIKGAGGKEQFYHICLEAGFSPLVIKKVMLGNTTIKTLTGEGAANRVYDFDDCVYYNTQNKIEIAQGGADFSTLPLNKKIVCTLVQKEIPHAYGISYNESDEDYNAYRAGIVQELPDNAMAVEVCIQFDGIRWMDSKGDWRPMDVDIKPEWCYTDERNPTWKPLGEFIHTGGDEGGAKNHFHGWSGKTSRFILKKTFSSAESYGRKISVRLIRETAKASQDQSTCNFLYCNTACYDVEKSTKDELVAADVLEEREKGLCTRLGLRIKADANTQDNLDSISIIVQGVARVWDGDKWSDDKRETCNLAAWVLEVLTSDTHPASRYNLDEIDLEAFGEWYEFCERQGFEANGVIDKGEKKSNILSTLCTNGCGTLIYDEMTGKLSVAIDSGDSNPIALLNADTVINIQSTKKFSRVADGVRVKFVNRDADYSVDTILVMADGGKYNPYNDTLTEQTLKYVTSASHAYKIAWKDIATLRARPRTVTVKVGLEGAYYPLYGKVELQHRTTRTGLGSGEVAEVRLSSLGYLDALIVKAGRIGVKEGDGVTYGLPLMARDGSFLSYLTGEVAAVKGDYITFNKILDGGERVRSSSKTLPHEGDFLSIGTLTSDGGWVNTYNTMTIVSTEATDSGYNLTLQDYNPSIYTFGGVIPTFKSNVTKRPDSHIIEQKPLDIGEVYEKISDSVKKLGSGSASAQEALNVAVHGIHFTPNHTVEDMSICMDELIQKIDEVRKEAVDGIEISENKIMVILEDPRKGLVYMLEMTAGGLKSIAKAVTGSSDYDTAVSAITQWAEGVTAEVTDSDGRGGLLAALSITKDGIINAVAGGGSEGEMSLSLTLPALLTTARAMELVAELGDDAGLLNRVYGLTDLKDDNGGNYWTIKKNANKNDIKELSDVLREHGLLSSNILLKANQIEVSGDTVFNGSGSINGRLSGIKGDIYQSLMTNPAHPEIVDESQSIISGGYIKTCLIDAFQIAAQNLILNVTANNGTRLYSIDYEDYINSQIAGTNADGTPKYKEGGFLISTNYTRGLRRNVTMTAQMEVVTAECNPANWVPTGCKRTPHSWNASTNKVEYYDVSTVTLSWGGSVPMSTSSVTVPPGGATTKFYLPEYPFIYINGVRHELLYTELAVIGCDMYANATGYYSKDYDLWINWVFSDGQSYPFRWNKDNGGGMHLYKSSDPVEVHYGYMTSNGTTTFLQSKYSPGAGVLIETTGDAHFMRTVEIGGDCNIEGRNTNIYQPTLLDGFTTNGCLFKPLVSFSIGWSGSNISTYVKSELVASIVKSEKYTLRGLENYQYQVNLTTRIAVPYVTRNSKKYLRLNAMSMNVDADTVGSYAANYYKVFRIYEAITDCSSIMGYSFVTGQSLAIIDKFTISFNWNGDHYQPTMAHCMVFIQ